MEALLIALQKLQHFAEDGSCAGFLLLARRAFTFSRPALILPLNRHGRLFERLNLGSAQSVWAAAEYVKHYASFAHNLILVSARPAFRR